MGDFNGMGQACSVVIAFENNKYLGLIFELSEGLGMHDAIAVALITGAPFMLRLIMLTGPGILGLHGIRSQDLTFEFLDVFACTHLPISYK